MRKALNDNPVVRAVVIGVMALLVAFLLFTRVVNRDSGAEESAAGSPDAAATEAGAAPAPADAAAGGAVPPVPEATAPAPATPAAPVTPDTTAPAPVGGAAGNFLPGPGLPEDVVVAYARNKAIALFIAKPKGLDDQALMLSVSQLEARGDVETFLVPVKDVAKYARITEGVDLNRTPALVIIRPRKLTEGNVPEATVSYGFRGPDSVATAVEDALYDGKDVTYDP